MYTQAMDIPSGDRDQAPVKSDASVRSRVRSQARARRFHRAEGLDAGALSQDA